MRIINNAMVIVLLHKKIVYWIVSYNAIITLYIVVDHLISYHEIMHVIGLLHIYTVFGYIG
jgi:hypothetical protein